MTVPKGATDRLAAIRDIFDSVVAAFRLMYNLTEYLTLNEALEGFRGRCGFVQYMPMKPTKKAASQNQLHMQHGSVPWKTA